MLHSVALATLGTWLLCYRVILRTSLRPVAELLTTGACGLSLSLLAPLLPWPPEGFRAITLGLVGLFLACCHPACTALVVAGSLGLGLGGFLWQLGLCAAVPVPADLETSTHAMVLTLVSLTLIVFFVFTPRVAGPVSLVFVLVPQLGALLLTVGLAGLGLPPRGLSPSDLLAASPCAGAGGLGLESPALRSLCVWLLLATSGVALQFLMAHQARLQAQKEAAAAAQGGSLAASLLPASARAEDGPAQLPNINGGNERLPIITKAIFADEGADLSHLTDIEQKLVEVCRKDEFERDRILWGGGLI